MDTVLLTGGAGFFGSILKRMLLSKGFRVVSIDLEEDEEVHEHLRSIRGDICDRRLLQDIFESEKISTVFHCAALLAHVTQNRKKLWKANVEGTRILAEEACRHQVEHFIFTSSNCLWGTEMGRPITETDETHPVEVYGESKLAGENILHAYKKQMQVIIIRCPTILDAGRLGLLSILFEFIDEGKRIWLVGGGENVYQFIYSEDLAHACLLAAQYNQSATFHIGSDRVRSFREVYAEIIRRAGTGARLSGIPRWIAIPLMRLAYVCHLSPLGPYQYNMIAGNFLFDTQKIKRELHWNPTCTNEEMLWKAYDYYHRHRREIEQREHVSAHKQAAKMGIIRLLKWLS
ncbi:NAD-dependent epimerase [Candidatus Peregrinibacteria bacterium CG10_big_fil_rev_8_21_14_0_10_49_10]|nr:MAG: NAD-dependent epimerase [Candidatus Peregrinibacteria bacterium CG10_big_fil_rev_8_21_14_0_10_49_10]